MALDPDIVRLPEDRLDAVAGRIEAALEQASDRGLTPAQVGRHARVDTATATQVLQWMTAHQYAHAISSRYYPGRP